MVWKTKPRGRAPHHSIVDQRWSRCVGSTRLHPQDHKRKKTANDNFRTKCSGEARLHKAERERYRYRRHTGFVDHTPCLWIAVPSWLPSPGQDRILWFTQPWLSPNCFLVGSIACCQHCVLGGGSTLCPKPTYPLWQQSWCQYWLGPLLRKGPTIRRKRAEPGAEPSETAEGFYGSCPQL